MTHTYTVTGMTCTGCQAKVQGLLSHVPAVSNVTIDLQRNEAIVQMERHIPTRDLQAALKDYPKYHLTKQAMPAAYIRGTSSTSQPNAPIAGPSPASWLSTYKPIL